MVDKFLVKHQTGGGTPVDITSSVMIDVDEGIEASADTFSLRLRDPILDSDGLRINVTKNDRIYIYLWSDGDTPANPVMDGFVKEYILNEVEGKRFWTINGQNSLEILLSAPIPAAYYSAGPTNTAPKIVRALVNRALGKWKATGYTPPITAELRSVDATNGKINDQVDAEGTAITFKATDWYQIDTPVFQQLDRISAEQYTGQTGKGSYISFIDNENRFNWVPRPKTVTSSLSEGDWLAMKVARSVFDVINMAIIYAGVDFNGKTIKTYKYNNAGLKAGIRARYFAWPHIAELLKDQSTYSSDDTGTTGPYGKADTAGNTDNATFRTKVIGIAKAEADSVVQTFGSLRYKVTLKLKGTTAYSKGSLYRIIHANVFRNTKDALVDFLDLRLYNIQHSFAKNGWTTDLEFIQDEYSVTGALI